MTDNEKKEKLRSKARKLKELAKRGEEGEKETAIKKYNDFIKEHNLNDSEIDTNMYRREFLDVLDAEEKDIAITVLLSVNPYAKYNTLAKSISAELDDEDFIEAKDKIDYFIKLWRIEKNALRTAFAIRHNNFFKPDSDAMNKWRERKVEPITKDENKNEFGDINKKVEQIRQDFEKDAEKVIKEVFNSNDDSIRTAFNIDRSLLMSDILLLANYVKTKRRVEK